MKEILQYSCL